MNKVYIKTFGCQMNVYDSAKVAELLCQNGYTLTDEALDADIMLFNTCFIREKAAEKLFSDLGRYKEIKDARTKEGKTTIMAVMGCVAQSLGDSLIKRVPFIDISVGPLVYHELPKLLGEILNKKTKHLTKTEFISGKEKFSCLPTSSKQGICSSVAIQEGCNNFCSYCCVPYTRGREYSRPAKDILEEIKVLAEERGAKEITLLGQNVNSYHGEGLKGLPWKLSHLIESVAKIDAIKRIRYMTSYPSDMSDDLIESFKNINKLQSYLHLPAQSGSDIILKQMNRRYTTKEYLEVIEKLTTARTDIAITSDFIVGFPGETDKDFNDTLELIKTVKYAGAFSFKYSPRPGTKAARMENQLPEKIKKERLSILQALLKTQQIEFNESKQGKTLEVLIEGNNSKGQLVGRTSYMQLVQINEKNKDLIGKIIPAQIIKAGASSLIGTL